MKTKRLLSIFAFCIFAFTSWAAAPGAPTAIVITPGNAILSVAFTATAASPVVTTYEYSTDNGTNWRTRTDGGGTSSPITISTISGVANTALVNGTTYNVQIRANNGTSGTATGNLQSCPLWGDGTSGSHYKISTTAHWSAFKAAITSTTSTGWPYCELSNSIDMSSISSFQV